MSVTHANFSQHLTWLWGHRQLIAERADLTLHVAPAAACLSTPTQRSGIGENISRQWSIRTKYIIRAEFSLSKLYRGGGRDGTHGSESQ